jgi:hypothetical protein
MQCRASRPLLRHRLVPMRRTCATRRTCANARAAPPADPASRATPLSPAEWKSMLASAVDMPRSDAAGGLRNISQPARQCRPVVLDLRNGYEWDAGHFDGAARPLEEEFRETPRPLGNGASCNDSDVPTAEPNGQGDLPAYLQGRSLDTPIMVRAGHFRSRILNDGDLDSSRRHHAWSYRLARAQEQKCAQS